MRFKSDFGVSGVHFGYLLGTFRDLLGVQMAPKTVQTAFQELPELQRGSKDPSRGPREIPKWLPGGPKRAPEAPKKPQEDSLRGPKWPPRGVET